MDFTKAIKANRRALLDDVFLRAELLIAPFQQALDTFLAKLFQAQLPADWRQRFRNFFATYPTDDLTIDEQSIADLEIWVEAWGRFCELLPEEETAPVAVDVSVTVEKVVEVNPPEPVPVEVLDPTPLVRAKSRDKGRVQISAGHRFYVDKLAEAEQYLAMMKQALDVLGAKLDRADFGEEVDVDDDVAAIEDLIWTFQDTIETARETWLREDLGAFLNDEFLKLPTPAAFGLPMYADEQQFERAMVLGRRVSERLGQRDASLSRIIVAGQAVEWAGTIAGFALGGGAIVTAAKQGGKWAVVKTIAVAAAGAVADRVVEAGMKAAGADDQTIRGAVLAASVVSFLMARRRMNTSGPLPKSVKKPSPHANTNADADLPGASKPGQPDLPSEASTTPHESSLAPSVHSSAGNLPSGKSAGKPPLPPPVAEDRVPMGIGKTERHLPHVKAAESEEALARYVHEETDDIVILWGKKVTSHGADVISFDPIRKRVVFWDDKYRTDPTKIYPTKTFTRAERRNNAIAEAKIAIDKSNLSTADKAAAHDSLKNMTYQTRTHGSGASLNSTFGDHNDF